MGAGKSGRWGIDGAPASRLRSAASAVIARPRHRWRSGWPPWCHDLTSHRAVPTLSEELARYNAAGVGCVGTRRESGQ
jgi:hypothetical protein